MNFFKALFGGKEENPEEKRKAEEAKNFDILKYDGVGAVKQHQGDYAIRCFKAALAIKEDLEIRDYLSQAYIMTGELTAAYEELLKLSEAEPDNVQIYMRMANVAFMMEDYNAMASACEKAMLIEPDAPSTLYTYAQACIGLEDDSNAIAMLTKTITLQENFGDAYLLRAQTYLRTGELQLANEDADWLLERAPENEDVLILKARIECEMGNQEEALNTYKHVIDVNPFSLDAYRERAEIYKKMGDNVNYEAEMAKLKEISADTITEEDIEKKVNEAYKNANPFA